MCGLSQHWYWALGLRDFSALGQQGWLVTRTLFLCSWLPHTCCLPVCLPAPSPCSSYTSSIYLIGASCLSPLLPVRTSVCHILCDSNRTSCSALLGVLCTPSLSLGLSLPHILCLCFSQDRSPPPQTVPHSLRLPPSLSASTPNAWGPLQPPPPLLPLEGTLRPGPAISECPCPHTHTTMG